MIRAVSVMAAAMLVLTSPPAGAVEAAAVGSREYKLALDPAGIARLEPEAAAAELWTTLLRPAIAQSADTVASGAFKRKRKQLYVRFFDTPGCLLWTHDLILRERGVLDGDRPTAEDRSLTLKFRTPELSEAARSPLLRPATNATGLKFEEDVTPVPPRPGGQPRTDAPPGAFRSAFSISLTPAPAPAVPATIGDLLAAVPALERHFAAGGVAVDRAAALGAGMEVRQVVFDDAAVGFGPVSQEFDLTYWYDRALPPGAAPVAVELSFKLDRLPGLDAIVVQRADALFARLQTALEPRLDRDPRPKTPIALPHGCGR